MGSKLLLLALVLGAVLVLTTAATATGFVNAQSPQAGSPTGQSQSNQGGNGNKDHNGGQNGGGVGGVAHGGPITIILSNCAMTKHLQIDCNATRSGGIRGLVITDFECRPNLDGSGYGQQCVVFTLPFKVIHVDCPTFRAPPYPSAVTCNILDGNRV